MSTLCNNFYWLQQGLRSEIVIDYDSWLLCCISICLWIFFFYIFALAMLWYTRYGIWVNFGILFLSQLQIGLLQLKLQFFTVKNIRFLKLVERVSWSKKTQCGQQESPPDLQLSAQVLSWIDFQLEINCQYFLTSK